MAPRHAGPNGNSASLYLSQSSVRRLSTTLTIAEVGMDSGDLIVCVAAVSDLTSVFNLQTTDDPVWKCRCDRECKVLHFVSGQGSGNTQTRQRKRL